MTTALEIMWGAKHLRSSTFVDLLCSFELSDFTQKLASELRQKDSSFPQDLSCLTSTQAKTFKSFCKHREVGFDELKSLFEPSRSNVLLAYIKDYNLKKRSSRTCKKSERINHVYEVFAALNVDRIQEQTLLDCFTADVWLELFINGSDAQRQYFPTPYLKRNGSMKI